jgi:DNA-binding transcriptional MerR regulator
MILPPPAGADAPIEKGPEAYRTIREVADAMDLPQHVLRFWETRFPQVRPLKRAGGRRYYRPDDVERLKLIRRLLYDEGYTIKGVQKLFKQQGVQALSAGAALDSGPLAESANGGAPAAGSTNGASMSRPQSKLADDDLAALREALAAIVDARRILVQARSLGS